MTYLEHVPTFFFDWITPDGRLDAADALEFSDWDQAEKAALQALGENVRDNAARSSHGDEFAVEVRDATGVIGRVAFTLRIDRAPPA